MSEASIPGFDESTDGGLELVDRVEVIVLEALALEDTEPDLNQLLRIPNQISIRLSQEAWKGRK